jgi:hypothetical protein
MRITMRLLTTILKPSALVLAGAIGTAVPASAAPTAPSDHASSKMQTSVEAAPAYHRGYYHEYYYNRPYRHWRGHRYGYRYWYGPRCHWSSYWQRMICRR